MKLLPLIGALLLSAAPVQAIETFEDLNKACGDEGVLELCLRMGWWSSAFAGYTVLCGLRDQGAIAPEVFAERVGRLMEFETEFEKDMWNSGIKAVLKDYPKCPIKPVR